MTGPCAQAEDSGLDPVVCGETDLAAEPGSRVRGQLEHCWRMLGTRRWGYTGGSQFWGGMEGARTRIRLQTVGCKESNGLGNIPSNLLAFHLRLTKSSQDKLRDMGIVDILHKLSQSPDSNLCDK